MALINLSPKTIYRSLEIFKDLIFGRRGALYSDMQAVRKTCTTYTIAVCTVKNA